MSDNATLPATGETIAADDVGGVKYQRIKLDLGGSGTSVPVVGALPVSAESLPLPLGAATETTIAALLSAAQAIKTAAETLASRTLDTGSVGGTVAVSNMVAQGLTDAQLRAAPVSMSMSNTLALTDAQLRATPPSVSDVSMAATTKQKNSAANLTDYGQVMLAQRRDNDTAETTADGQYTALKQDEAGRLKVASQPAGYAIVSGNIVAAAGTVVCDVSRASNVMLMLTAASLVGHNATFEGSLDSTNGTDGTWFGIQAVRSNANTIETATGVLAATPAYAWEASVNGLAWVRVRATAHTSGTAIWKIQRGTYATEPIPAAQISGTQPVSGSLTATLVASAVRAGFVAGSGIWFDDNSTVLAAAATFTGSSRDLTVTATATAFANAATYPQEARISAESDQSGTLWLEVSRDNTLWRRVKSVPTAAVTGGGQYAEIIHRPSWRYLRAGFTNGATLQTRFSIGSVLMAA